MFESRATEVEVLDDLLRTLRSVGVAADDASRIDQIALLETVKRAASAAQARVTAQFAASQRARQIEAGVPPERASRGVADQVARAMRESPHRGSTFVGMCTALVHEMPNTLAALTEGQISEWAATGLVRETAVLQREHRREVDAELDPMMRAAGTSEGSLVRAAKALAQRLDAAAAVKRAAKAESERRVSVRPAPDTMVWLSALLPVADGVAAFAALDRAAGTAAARGDKRSRGQVMADTLVARLTGRDPLTEPVPVEVTLVMTGSSLFGDPEQPQYDEPATVRAPGQTPVPVAAAVARHLVSAAGAAGVAWLRRLFASPGSDQLVALDSRSRRFPARLAKLLTLADQICRTPWCDAPVRQADHVRALAEGGSTDVENGQGLCQRCNLAKTAPGWHAARAPDGTVTTTTPTGHRYDSHAPPALGWPPSRARRPVHVEVAGDLWVHSRSA